MFVVQTVVLTWLAVGAWFHHPKPRPCAWRTEAVEMHYVDGTVATWTAHICDWKKTQ